VKAQENENQTMEDVMRVTANTATVSTYPVTDAEFERVMHEAANAARAVNVDLLGIRKGCTEG